MNEPFIEKHAINANHGVCRRDREPGSLIF